MRRSRDQTRGSNPKTKDENGGQTSPIFWSFQKIWRIQSWSRQTKETNTIARNSWHFSWTLGNTNQWNSWIGNDWRKEIKITSNQNCFGNVWTFLRNQSQSSAQVSTQGTTKEFKVKTFILTIYFQMWSWKGGINEKCDNREKKTRTWKKSEKCEKRDKCEKVKIAKNAKITKIRKSMGKAKNAKIVKKDIKNAEKSRIRIKTR